MDLPFAMLNVLAILLTAALILGVVGCIVAMICFGIKEMYYFIKNLSER